MLIDMFAAAHSENFFRYLLQISNFHVFDFSDLMTSSLPVYKNEALNIHFEETGYEHSDQILNMTTIIVFFLIALIFVSLMLAIRCACCCQRVKGYAKR